MGDLGKMFGGIASEAQRAASRTAKNFSKNAKASGGPIRQLDNSILTKSIGAGNTMRKIGNEYGVSRDTSSMFASLASSATYYGAYGAIGGGAIGIGVGIGRDDTTVGGGAIAGTASGVGLGAIGGAGATAVAAAIAKSIR